MVAALTPLPDLGVPVESHALSGLDSLLSIVQMPGGVPVGTNGTAARTRRQLRHQGFVPRIEDLLPRLRQGCRIVLR